MALLEVSRCGNLTGEGRGMAGSRMWKAGGQPGTGGFGFDVDAQRCYSKSIKKVLPIDGQPDYLVTK